MGIVEKTEASTLESAPMAHLELAKKFLEEGERLKDKAAEEAIKSLTFSIRLADALERVEDRGRWTVSDLEKAVRKLRAEEPRIVDWWDHANYLHVWGFHEARLELRKRASGDAPGLCEIAG